MINIKEKVFEILSLVLGDDATGIYGDYAFYESTDPETTFYSTVTEKGFGWVIEDVDKVSIKNGFSRIVIIPEKENFVIKLPITDIYDHLAKVHMKQEADICIPVGEVCAIPKEKYSSVEEGFMCCATYNRDCDLMDEENAIFEEVPDELKTLFLPNEYIGEFNGIPVYIQEKVQCTAEDMEYEGTIDEETYFKYFNKAENLSKKTKYFELIESFLADCINVYGEAITEKLLTFLRDNCINDLHTGNIGYKQDGSPCIIDYAGSPEEILWEKPE